MSGFKGRQFNRAVAVIEFVMLLNSFMMDSIYTKLQYIWLLQKIVSNSYATLDKSNKCYSFSSMSCYEKLKRCCPPFSLAVLYAVTVILTYWVTLAIIGIRIYVDNYSIDIVGNYSDNSHALVSGNLKNTSDTGNYKTSPFTCYMILCGAYFPIASDLVYIIANKYYFIQMFEMVRNDGLSSEDMEGYHKLFSFFIDFITYLW